MPPWGRRPSLLLAVFALLCLLALRPRQPGGRRGARTLPGAEKDRERVDVGPAGQFGDGREPLPGGCRLICKPSALADAVLRALRRSAAGAGPAPRGIPGPTYRPSATSCCRWGRGEAGQGTCSWRMMGW